MSVFRLDLVIRPPDEMRLWSLQEDDGYESEDGSGPSYDLLRYHQFYLSMPLVGGVSRWSSTTKSALEGAHSTLNSGYTQEENEQFGGDVRASFKVDVSRTTSKSLALIRRCIVLMDLVAPFAEVALVLPRYKTPLPPAPATPKVVKKKVAKKGKKKIKAQGSSRARTVPQF